MSVSAPRRLADREGGFALLELLASLTLLALLIAMMPGTLRLGKRAWETPGGTMDTPDAAAVAFVATTAQGALPVFVRDSLGLGGRVAFRGDADSLSFVAELGSGPAGGGLYRIGLSASDGRPPVLSLALFREAVSDPAPLEERRLSRTYRSVSFKYYGSPAPGAAASWQDSWHRSDRLPDLIDFVAAANTNTKSASLQARVELKMRPEF